MVEAWGLLQQHTTKLNIEELLKHMYEICQEMGLMEDLLKLPFTDTEKVSLEGKQKNLHCLFGKGRGQNRNRRLKCVISHRSVWRSFYRPGLVFRTMNSS